uniref:ISXO2-like transposase domain-containing protein n=1 Tax=Spongospora subterranea TaxID=70186 RepID=A0A0H5REA9_9EUKA|eukprot:CRZ12585.1 hypothetical protein [Spongospora subterranea]
MNEFMKFGAKLISGADVFHIGYDISARIVSAIIQFPCMVPYALQYRDFTIADATFNISAYNLVLIVFTNVDCLGKSTIPAITLAPSETASIIEESLQLCSLAQPESTLMSDGAVAYYTVSESLNMKHKLCVRLGIS